MGTWIESKYKPEYCDVAVKVLSEGKSLAAVCVQIGICRPTLYVWKETHPDFANALNFGMQQSQLYWENLGQNGISGDIKGFGSAPWIFTMKSRFRDDYAEEKEHKSVSDSIVEKLIDKLVD